jgi:hypothetical protein
MTDSEKDLIKSLEELIEIIVMEKLKDIKIPVECSCCKCKDGKDV